MAAAAAHVDAARADALSRAPQRNLDNQAQATIEMQKINAAKLKCIDKMAGVAGSDSDDDYDEEEYDDQEEHAYSLFCHDKRRQASGSRNQRKKNRKRPNFKASSPEQRERFEERYREEKRQEEEERKQEREFRQAREKEQQKMTQERKASEKRCRKTSSKSCTKKKRHDAEVAAAAKKKEVAAAKKKTAAAAAAAAADPGANGESAATAAAAEEEEVAAVVKTTAANSPVTFNNDHPVACAIRANCQQILFEHFCFLGHR